MTYSRPYVNNMLKNHPHGDTFKEIRYLARYIESYVPPVPDPDETRAQKILYSILNGFFTMLFSASTRSDRMEKNFPKYYEQLNQKLSDLMDVLDCSKDSLWLATYMIEEGASGCPLAVSSFEEYLEKCELNPRRNQPQMPSDP